MNSLLAYIALLSFISISPSINLPSTSPSLPCLSPLQLFVHTDSSASISKVMWNVTNNPPAAFPLKSILCQKHEMSMERILSSVAWPRSLCILGGWCVCVCVLWGRWNVHCAIYCLAWRPQRDVVTGDWPVITAFRPSIKLHTLIKLVSVKLRQPCWLCLPMCASVFWVTEGGRGLDVTPPSGKHTCTQASNRHPQTPYHLPAEQPRQHKKRGPCLIILYRGI